MNSESQYLSIVQKIIAEGKRKENRTGIDTICLPGGASISHDCKDGFPLLTTCRKPFKVMATELEGFIKGITSKKWYQDRGCHIWDEWCTSDKVPYGTDEKTKESPKKTGRNEGSNASDGNSSKKYSPEDDEKKIHLGGYGPSPGYGKRHERIKGGDINSRDHYVNWCRAHKKYLDIFYDIMGEGIKNLKEHTGQPSKRDFYAFAYANSNGRISPYI